MSTARRHTALRIRSATSQDIDVQAKRGLVVSAGTIRELTVSQPDVCASGSASDETSVRVTCYNIRSKKEGSSTGD
jgi:hypothetical protein